MRLVALRKRKRLWHASSKNEVGTTEAGELLRTVAHEIEGDFEGVASPPLLKGTTGFYRRYRELARELKTTIQKTSN